MKKKVCQSHVIISAGKALPKFYCQPLISVWEIGSLLW